jgi:putative transposase
MSFVATTGGIGGDHVRDLMVDAVEHHFGRINRLPNAIEWLTDNGSCYIARSTTDFARAMGLNQERRRFKAPKATAWPKPSSGPSREITSGSILSRMPTHS